MLGRFLTAAYSRKSALFFCGFYDAFALLVNAYDTTLTLDTRTNECSSISYTVALARGVVPRKTNNVLFCLEVYDLIPKQGAIDTRAEFRRLQWKIVYVYFGRFNILRC